MNTEDLTITLVRSGKGDCIHLHYNGHNLIVDSGPTSAAGEFRKLCGSILNSKEILDALIITHYDDDHIGGILKVGDLGFQGIYLNAYDGITDNGNLSAAQNQRLFHMLPDAVVHSSIQAGDVIAIGGATLTVHAPTAMDLSKVMSQMKEADVPLGGVSDWTFSFDELMDRNYPSQDTSVSNQASIVFTFEYGNNRILFTGDAGVDRIPGGSYSLVKLPHHGSARNISDEMITKLDAKAFLICADGTSHPSKQTIAKLLKFKEKVHIYSNYNWWMRGFLNPEDMKYIKSGRLTFSLT